MSIVAGIVQYSNKIDRFYDDEATLCSRALSRGENVAGYNSDSGLAAPGAIGTGSGAFGEGMAGAEWLAFLDTVRTERFREILDLVGLLPLVARAA